MFEDDTAAPCRVRTASGLFRLVQVRSPGSAVLVPALPYVILAHHAVRARMRLDGPYCRRKSGSYRLVPL